MFVRSGIREKSSPRAGWAYGAGFGTCRRIVNVRLKQRRLRRLRRLTRLTKPAHSGREAGDGGPMNGFRRGRADARRGRVFEDLLCGVLGAVTGIWVFQDFSLFHGSGLFVGAALAAMLGGMVLVRLVRVFREPASRHGDQEERSLPTVHPVR